MPNILALHCTLLHMASPAHACQISTVQVLCCSYFCRNFTQAESYVCCALGWSRGRSRTTPHALGELWQLACMAAMWLPSLANGLGTIDPSGA